MQETFDPITQQLVQTMINYVNRSSGVVDGAKLPISKQYTSYYVYCTPVERQACHQSLKQLQAQGLIKCSWHPRVLEAFETLKEILIPSGGRLLDQLGILSHAEVVAYGNARLHEMRCGVGWIDYKIDEITERWRMGGKYVLLGPQHIEEAMVSFSVAKQLADQSINGRCVRGLSIDLFGHPDIIIDNARVVAMICESQLQQAARELDAIDRLASLGLCEEAPALRIRGGIEVHFKNGAVFTGLAEPSASWVFESVQQVALRGDYVPDYVLTIESLVTYHRYVSKVKDKGLILYAGAFPSNQFLEIYQAIVANLPENIEVFHWGDIDMAAFRAVIALQAVVLDREVKPFQMGVEDVQVPETNSKPLNLQKMRKLGFSCDGAMRRVISEIVMLPDDRRFESKQELMDVRAPLCALEPSE